MSEREYCQIKFGLGGEILDVPENKGLLEQIRATPVLSPENLFKLANFYQEYSTNQPLGNHLAFLALQAVTPSIRLQKAVAEGEPLAFDLVTELGDAYEDWKNGPDPKELANDPDEQPAKMAVRHFAGLLVETRTNGDGVQPFFIIGFSPDPASLPEDQSR